MAAGLDLVVIGAGPGGYVAAHRAAQLGLKTALVEKDDRLGGTCLLRGCIPTKSLIHAAEVWLTCSRKARNFGVDTGQTSFDWSRIRKRKDLATLKGARGVELMLHQGGVEVIHGAGRLDGPGRVVVDTPGGEIPLEAPRIILATGSVPAVLPGIEPDGQTILTSDHLLELERVPESLVVLGAGAVGLELATVMQSFGCRTTLVEAMDQVLPLEDPECAAEVAAALRRLKMQVLTGWKAKGVVVDGQGVTVELQNAHDRHEYRSEQAGCLLVAVGRRPVTRGIGLETVQVVTDRRGFIQTDSMMQTATPGLYAIGDIVPTPQLAHLASQEALVAVDHAAGRPLPPVNLQAVPSCTYSSPEVASVGMQEAAAREAGFLVRTGRFPFSALGKASILGEPQGFIKVVADAETDRVLGVHMVGPRVTELIAAACSAVDRRVTVAEWARTIHPHPTLSEALGEAVLAAAGRPLHGG